MKIFDHRRKPQLDGQGQGIFNSTAWLEEGNGFYVSASAMRVQWRLFRRELHRRLKLNDTAFLRQNYSKLVGYPRSSMLLLGYAAEMFLKGALAKLYEGCSAEMFERDVKRFGHDFVRLARECDFPQWRSQRANLALLAAMVAGDARYPVTPVEHRDFFELSNTRTANIWNRKSFMELRRLVRDLLAHSTRIDRDSDNPSSVVRYQWEDDGYIVIRAGGHVWQRATYRKPKTGGRTDAEAMQELREIIDSQAPRLGAQPNSFVIIEDVRATPRRHARTVIHTDPRPKLS